MMHTGWSSEKKKVGIGRLIDWMGLVWFAEFRHCWNSVKNSVIAGISSLRGVSETKQSRSKLNKS